MRIVGVASAPKATVLANLRAIGPHARFIDEMFPALWSAGEHYVIDPVGMVAQAAKETAWGRYSGKVPAWFCNTAGIKVANPPEVMRIIGTTDSNHTLCHSQFASFWVGAEVHAQHLRAYAGVPVVDRIYDPRYDAVTKRATEWKDLTVWSESATYGTELEAMMARLSQPV